MAEDNPEAPRVMLMSGEKVGLALMQKADVPVFTRWNQDLEFTARIGTPGDAHTLEMREDFFKQNCRVRSDEVDFSVIELGTGRLVGFGGLFDITRAMVATMFVGIGEAEARRKGFGTEACRLICEYGFFFRNLYSIKVEVHAYNHAARRVYERLGFKPAGRLRGANLLNDRRYDEIIMDLLRSELELKHVGRFAGLVSALSGIAPPEQGRKPVMRRLLPLSVRRARTGASRRLLAAFAVAVLTAFTGWAAVGAAEAEAADIMPDAPAQPPVPPDDPAVQSRLPGCAVWTDRCVTCEHAAGRISCSNIGIACQPRAVECLLRESVEKKPDTEKPAEEKKQN